MGKKTPLILVIILILSIILRFININQSLWLDEAAQAIMSSRGLSYVWFGRGNDFHPPLFYALAFFWQTFSTSEIWLRLLPITFGVLNVWLMYFFAKHLFASNKAGFTSAFLLAINPYHIYYSQEYRSYSLLCLLGTLALYLLYQKKFFLLSLINTLLFYTHYASFFLILAQIVYSRKYQKQSTIALVKSLSLSTLLYLPWLVQMAPQLSSGLQIDTLLPGWSSLLSVTPLKILPMTLFKLAAGRISFLSRPLYGLYIISVLSILFSAFVFLRNHRQFIFTWLFLPVFFMMLASLFIPQNQPFRVIYILPAIILMFTDVCLRFPKLFFTLLLYISLVGNISYYTRPRLQREQWREASQFLTHQNQPVIFTFSAPFAPLLWYSPGLEYVSAADKYPADPVQVSQRLRPLTDSVKSVFVLDYLTGLTDPSRLVDSYLQQSGFQQKQIYNFEGVGFIRQYQKG